MRRLGNPRKIDDVMLRQLWADNASTDDIGERFGVTPEAVYIRARRLGLPSRSQRPKPKPRAAVNGNRKCLCCGAAFLSRWFGNRVCKSCKRNRWPDLIGAMD